MLINSYRINGFATGVSTLGGQAFGAGEYMLVGAVAQRAMILNLLMAIIVFLGWTQALPSLMLTLGELVILLQNYANRLIQTYYRYWRI